MKILLSVQEFDSCFRDMYEKLSQIAIVDVADLDNYTLEDYDIFIGKMLKKEKLDNANKLKVIFTYKTGVDGFPLEELAKRNIMLVNSHADSKIIAEYAFGLTISLVNRITEFDHDLRKGIWYHSENEYWNSIFSMKIGLLGYGHIGKAIHQILLNNQIDTYTIDRGHSYQNINLVKNINELIDQCDVLICSVPMTKETTDLIDQKLLSKMHNKYIVNIGRYNVINQESLYQALKEKTLKAAAIDTWEEKPKNKNELLLPSKYDFHGLKNIIITPHSAMRVAEGHKNYVDDIYIKIRKYLEFNQLTDVVDYKKGY